jgi:hypothetical protein
MMGRPEGDDVSADHIRWGVYMFGPPPSPLADTLNGGGTVVGTVVRSGWGWKCGGCGEGLASAGVTDRKLANPPAPPTWADRHEAHGAWVNHPEHCNIRAGGACSCGRTT